MRRRVLIGLSVGAVALVVALWGVPIGRIGAALSRARLAWLLPTAAVFLTQQVLRAWRQLVLVSAVQPALKMRDSLAVLCIGFFCINTLPARIGEVVRPTLLLERAGVPLGSGFAMVFLERTIDLCAALTMLAMVAWLVPVASATVTVQGQTIDWLGAGRIAAATLLPLLVGGLVAVLVLGRPLLGRLDRWRPATPATDSSVRLRVWHGVHGFLTSFVSGLDALKSPGRLAAVLGLTVLTWSISGLMYVFIAHAYDVTELIGWGEGIGIMSITMLGTVLPAPPGFAGTYEAFARGALALFGVRGDALDSTAIAYALTIHWWLYAVQASTALWFLVRDRISLRRLVAQAVAGRSQAQRSATRSSSTA